jgi:hypothetical protein
MDLKSLNPWKRCTIEIDIKNRIVGGIPNDPNLIEGWTLANMKEAKEEERKKIAETTLEEIGDAVKEKAEGMWTVFKRNENGIYIEGRQVKSMFKEAANVTRDFLIKAESKSGVELDEEDDKIVAEAEEKKGKKKGKKGAGRSRFTNLKSRVAERLMIEDERIYFVRDGKNLLKADGNEDRAIHVIGAQGPRTALKRVDFVNAPATLKMTARYLDDGVVDIDLIDFFLRYACYGGLGADRSQGNGIFIPKPTIALDK